MTTGRLIDQLIFIRDYEVSTSAEEETINLACNVLERFPNDTDIQELLDYLRDKEKDVRRVCSNH